MNPTNPGNKKKKEQLLEALSQTSAAEHFNAEATEELSNALENKNPTNDIDEKDIRNNILETLDSQEIQDNFVDFYPEDDERSFESSGTIEEDPFDQIDESHVDNQLQSDYIPGRYKVRSLLGKGANGSVFSVIDNNLERSVAVKFLHPRKAETPENIALFISEAQNTAQLNHPNILPIHDLNFTDGSIPYYTMRRVRGHTLRELIGQQGADTHPLLSNCSKKIDILIKVCDAISYAHAHGIIHGDIKPANIIVGDHGEVTLLDWGVGASHSAQDDIQKTVFGTPMYMAPEQAHKESPNEASDIYCIGSTLLHTLTERPPLKIVEPNRFWDEKRAGLYQDFSKAESQHIPPPLISLTHKCLAIDPADRYSNIDQLKSDLLAFQGGERVSAHKDSTWGLCKRIYIKNKFAANVIIATCLASLLIVYLIYLEKQKELSEWKIAYEEDFDHYTNEDILQNWHLTEYFNWQHDNKKEIDSSTNNVWQIKNGALTNSVPYAHFRGTQNISPNINIAGPIKFTVDIRSENGKPLCNVFIGGRSRFEGYTFHVGQWGGANQVTLTKGKELTTLTYSKIPFEVANTDTVRYTVEKDGDLIRFSMNDIPVIAYHDPLPLVGHEHQYIGLENDQKIIDNLVIYSKAPPEKVPAINTADTYLSRGYNSLALDTYDSLKIDHPKNKEIDAIATFRSAQCLFNLQQFFEAKIRLLNFVSTHHTHRYYIHGLTNLANIFIETQDFSKADEYLQKIGAQFPAHPQTRWIYDRAVNRIGASINLSEHSYIEKDVQDGILHMAQSIARWETYGQFEIREYSNINKSRCAFTLFRLGLREELCQYFPKSKYTLRHYSRTNNLAALRKDFPWSASISGHLVQQRDFQALLTEQANGNFSLYNYWGDIESLDALRSFAQKQNQKAIVTACERQAERLQPYWQELNQLIRENKHTEASTFLSTIENNHFHWTHRLFYNFIGQEQLIFNYDEADPLTKILAHSALALRAWGNQDLSSCRKHLTTLHDYRGDYMGSTIACFTIDPFLRWTQDQDSAAFEKSLRKSIEKVGKKYANKISSQLQYILGDISFEELCAIPINCAADGHPHEYLHVLTGIQQELQGNQKAALAAYAQINTPTKNLSTSDAYLFARTRERLLHHD